MSACQSKFIDVNNARMYYLEQGIGDPILFIHGMPTSSYVWRKIIPSLATDARCIAPDLIGMGQSSKPDIEFSVYEHIEFLEAFVDVLGLSNITLVVHGWGSVIGLAFANRHPDRVKAMAFYESHLRPTTSWEMLSLPVQQVASLLGRPGASYRAIVKQNYLISQLLPNSVMNELPEEDYAVYCKPFETPASRKPLWRYAQDLPLGDGPVDVVQLIAEYSKWLQKAPQPKLLMYGVPGFITTMDTITWARDNISNLQLVEFDCSLHFAQETMPDKFAKALHEWYTQTVLENVRLS